MTKTDNTEEEEFDSSQYVPVIHEGWHVDRVTPYVRQRPCMNVALYMRASIQPNEKFKAEDFRRPSGAPLTIDKMLFDNVPCPNCGNPVRMGDFRKAFRLAMQRPDAQQLIEEM